MSSLLAAAPLGAAAQVNEEFVYNDERFADLQMLRYKVEGFENLTLQQKKYIYYLTEASLQGRDILYDQNGKYNLRIRKVLESIYTDYQGNRQSDDFKALTVYLKRVWFSNGIHHHYGSEKFVPGFSEKFFRQAVMSLPASKLPLAEGQSAAQLCDVLCPVIFNPQVMPKRVNQADGVDLLLTSAENYYSGVSQEEAEEFYNNQRDLDDPHPVMTGMNSRLVKDSDGTIREVRWTANGLYGQSIARIIYWLQKAKPFAENEKQQQVIDKLIEFYQTGDLRTFDEYSILWVGDVDSRVDFVN